MGLYNAINIALKRQENKQDLGDLKHAEIFGTAIKRVKAADLNLVNLQADRALCLSGLFAISKAHAWPTASDEIGAMAESLEIGFSTYAVDFHAILQGRSHGTRGFCRNYVIYLQNSPRSI